MLPSPEPRPEIEEIKIRPNHIPSWGASCPCYHCQNLETELINSLEHILFGDVHNRSRDELEDRAAEAIAAWNERNE